MGSIDTIERLQSVLGNSFAVESLIGSGGFAEVYRVRDLSLDRLVAVKVVRPDLVLVGELVTRFKREAQAVAFFRHPNIIEIYAVGERNGLAYFIMPLIQGETLRALLDRERVLSIEEAKRVLEAAAGALEAAHRKGIVHRDVKPENILLEEPDRRVLLTDFGIAKAMGGEQSGVTGSGMFVGTPEYISPEQATGDAVDHRADIYSLGVVAYRMITGRLPFEAETAQATIAKHITQEPTSVRLLRPDCPTDLAMLVDRCLAKSPAERWQEAAALVHALRPSTPVHVESRQATPTIPAPMPAGGPDSPPTPVEQPWDLARAAALGAFRKDVRGGALISAGAVLVDFGMTGAVGLSVLAVIAASVFVAIRYGRLWAAGYDWRDVLGRKPTSKESGHRSGGATTGHRTVELGRHAQIVRECRSDRMDIVRIFEQMPHAQQSRYPALSSTTDHLLARIQNGARQLTVLEGRSQEEEEALGKRRLSMSVGGSELAEAAITRQLRALEEVRAARQHTYGEMKLYVGALKDIRLTIGMPAGEEGADSLSQAVWTGGETLRREDG